MTKCSLLMQRLISFVSVMFFFGSGIAVSIMIANWPVKCAVMAGFTVLLFFGCVRYYLANEHQISKWYRSTLSGWRRPLFDFVVFGVPCLALMSVALCFVYAAVLI